MLKRRTSRTSSTSSLQQDDIWWGGGVVYEISLAQVRITKGKSFIDVTQITDERKYGDLQGQTGLYAKKQLEPRKHQNSTTNG